MATFTNDQLAELRRRLEGEANSPYVKVVLDSVFQSIEDWFETSGRAGISTAINSATQPSGITLTPAQKTLAVKIWLLHKFQRGG